MIFLLDAYMFSRDRYREENEEYQDEALSSLRGYHTETAMVSQCYADQKAYVVKHAK